MTDPVLASDGTFWNNLLPWAFTLIIDQHLKSRKQPPILNDQGQQNISHISGHTYERASIEDWLRHNRHSPITKAPLNHGVLLPNLLLRQAATTLLGYEPRLSCPL